MKRFLLLWVDLAVVLLVGTGLVSYFVFKRVDLRLVALVQVLAVPALQAAVLLWVGGEWSLLALLEVVRETRRRTIVVALLALDLGVLTLGWGLWARPPFGVAAVRTLQPLWTGGKTIAAALAACVLAVRAIRTAKERVWLGIAALAAVALAAQPFRHWIDPLADREVIFQLPTVVRWLMVYGGIFVVAVAMLVHTGTVLRASSRLGGFFVDAALAVAFLAGLVTVPNIFLKPYLVEPSAAVVKTLLSLAATFTLAAFLAALTEPTPSPLPHAQSGPET